MRSIIPIQGYTADLLKELGIYLDTVENLDEEDRLVEEVYIYSTKSTLKKFKGMNFDTARKIMMYKRSMKLIRLLK